MRFSDFLLVSDPGDLEFIVGYTEDENIRINVSDFFGNQILDLEILGIFLFLQELKH
jgi:hypothetical protein